MLTSFKSHFQNQNPSLWSFDGELSDIRDDHFTSKLLLNGAAEPNGRCRLQSEEPPEKEERAWGQKSVSTGNDILAASGMTSSR